MWLQSLLYSTAVCTILAFPASAQTAPQPPLFKNQIARPMEQVIVDLQAAGRAADAATLKQILADTGYPQKLLGALDRRLGRVRPPKRDASGRLPRIAKSLARVAKRWAAQLPAIESEQERRRAAKILLRIDYDIAEAHKALGRVELNGRWVSAEEKTLSARQSEILAALQTARGLQPEVTVQESSHELLLHVHGEKGHLLECHGIKIHTRWPIGKTTRLLRNLVRCVAFSKWLIDGGEIVLPQKLRHTSILFTGAPHYNKAAQFDIRGGNARRPENLEKLASYYRKDSSLVNNRVTESHALAGIFSHVADVVGDRIYREKHHPTLIVGHTNWALMSMFGTSLPGITFRETKKNEGTTTSKEDEEMEMLFGAGLMGARSWLQHKVTKGEDPPWSRSFLDQVGRIQGVDMLKTTFVAEYLHQHGMFRVVLDASQSGVGKSQAEIIASLEAGLKKVGVGSSLHEFESRWREWMRGAGGPGSALLSRLQGRSAGLSKADIAVINHLSSIRSAALTHPQLGVLPEITMDHSLSAQALLHAKYLNRHPAQVEKWPDAHEEYTDRDGFTPEGCWAGNHSVIAPGVRSGPEAVDGWMATFYHRLPLIHPGLLRIGFGLDKKIAVLDSGSIVRDVDGPWEVAWPPADAKNVGRRFQPELPNPYPGENQSAWGYPITLQLGPREKGGAPSITMTLHEKDASAAPMDCFLSTPQNPGNALLVPELCWCLIPKRHLKSETKYHVKAVFRGDESRTLNWTFTTGR